MLDRIDLLETRVNESLTTYNRHRRLLDALVAMLEEEKPLDQATMKERIERLDHQIVLEEAGHPAFTERKPSSARSAAAPTPPKSAVSPAAEQRGLEGLYNQSTRRLDRQDNYGRKTLIRDSVKDKGSSGR